MIQIITHYVRLTKLGANLKHSKVLYSQNIINKIMKLFQLE